MVIEVHAAKFTNEKETANIRQAILRYDITHPVVIDPDRPGATPVRSARLALFYAD